MTIKLRSIKDAPSPPTVENARWLPGLRVQSATEGKTAADLLDLQLYGCRCSTTASTIVDARRDMSPLPRSHEAALVRDQSMQRDDIVCRHAVGSRGVFKAEKLAA